MTLTPENRGKTYLAPRIVFHNDLIVEAFANFFKFAVSTFVDV